MKQYWIDEKWVDEFPAQAIGTVPVARLVTDTQIAAWSEVSPTYVYADASTGPATVILPADSGNVIVVKNDSSTNPVTVVPQGTDTVLYVANCMLTMQGESIHLRKNGTNWDAIG